MSKRREERKNGLCPYPFEGIINTINRKWALQIIALIGNHGQLRFTKILETCTGISSGVLATRLKELEEQGLITRTSYSEIPPRVEYSLTSNGKELRRLITPLMRWASKRRKN